MIVYRASHPAEGEALERYRELLGKGLIEPRALEIYVMNADGSKKRQVTNNGAANFAPYFTRTASASFSIESSPTRRGETSTST